MSGQRSPREGMQPGDRRPVTSRLLWQETQHQRLFELLDDLAGKAELATVLADLHRYAEEHFAIEEAYMEAVDFPERVAHQRAHNKFRKQLVELSEAGAGAESTRDMTAMFLREWLTRHIYGTDQALEAFIVASELK